MREFGDLVNIYSDKHKLNRNKMKIYKQYLRDKNRNPIGLVVLDKEGNYGWSKLRKGDKFTKELANKIAFNRYYHYQVSDNIPQEVPSDIEKLLNKLNVKIWK